MRPIDADKAIERIDALCEKYKSNIRNDALLKHTRTFIKRCPTVEPKTGYWIRWYENIEQELCTIHDPHCKCSECDQEYDPYIASLFNYCPNCGIKIVEQTEKSEE